MEDTQTIKRQILEKGIKALLDEAKVPQRIHLQVTKALADRMEAHKKDIELHHAVLAKHEQNMKDTKSVMQEHERQIEGWDVTSKHLLSIEHIKGDKGDSPIKGIDYFDGEPGKDADEEAVLSRILGVLSSYIPEPIPGKDAEFDQAAIVKAVIKEIQISKSLDLTHIKGAQKFIKDGVSYKMEELMHGGGSKNSGSGINPQIPVGTIDSVNRSFTTTGLVKVAFVDGSPDAGAVITGTTNSTILYSIPPQQYVFAL